MRLRRRKRLALAAVVLAALATDFVLSALPSTAAEAGSAALAGGSASQNSEWLIKSWQTEDGLPENSATAMVQTPDGYLWLGTFSGLVRFDGVHFTVFDEKNTPELSSSGIVNLHLDKKGRLWISTYRGLILHEGTGWQILTRAEMPENEFVRTFTERDNGDLLLTKFNGDVVEFSNGRFTKLPPPPGDPHGGYLGHVDELGRWWVVQNAFVGRWDGKGWVRTISVSAAASSVGCTKAKDGGLWLLAGQELRKYSRGAEVLHVHLPELPGAFWSMSEDSRGNVWICSYDKGLCQVSPDGRMRRWDENHGLTYHGVRFAYEDTENDIWVGTSGGGLMRFKLRRFQSFGAERGLSERVVKSVWPTSGGGLWIATYGQGLFRLEQTGITNVPIPGWTNELYGQSVLTDKTGRTWIGTYGQGLWVSSQNGFERFPFGQTRGDNVIALFEDSQGRIWLSDGQEVSVFDSGTFHRYPKEQGLSPPGVCCFGEDRDKVVWLSSFQGLFRLQKDRFVEVRDNKNRSIPEVTSIHSDVDNCLWLGSVSEGLLRYRNGSFSRIEHEAGLPITSVHGIIEDNDGFFWLTSNRGVVHARRKDLESAAEGGGARLFCQLLDLSDGLPSVEFTREQQPTCAKDAYGRLWFATLKGVAMADPTRFRINSNAPPVRIEQVIYHVSAEPGAENAKTERLSESLFLEKLNLPPGSRNVEIHYTALSYTSPEKVQFQIRLRSRGPEWQDVGNRRVAYFDELRPGENVFEVRAANDDGVWNETGASLAFAVAPLFWQTAWFRALMWGAVAVEAILIIALLRAMERRHRGKLELRERLRFEQLISELSRVFINLPSEKLDAQIKESLRRVGEYLKFDIAAFSTFSSGGKEGTVSMVWRSPVVKEITCDRLEEDLPWSANELAQGRDVWLPSTASLPAEAETDRATFARYGVQSSYQVPLYAGGTVLASLSLCSVRERRELTRELLQRQRLIGEVFVNALARKLAEDRQRESEARFRIVADSAPVMIWMSGVDKQCTFFNKTWLDFTGRTMEQELGNGWTEGVHRADLKRCLQSYVEAFDARKQFVLHYRLRRNDGEYRWISDTGIPRYDSQKNFAGYIGSCIDFTERKEAEEKFRLAVETSPNAILLVDHQGRIVLANQQTEAMFGYNTAELIGQSMEMLVPERFRGQHPDHRNEFYASPMAREMGQGRELFVRRKDGSEVEVEIALNPIHAQEETLVLTTIVDVTERKRKDRALRESEERMSLAAEAANLGMWMWDIPQQKIWTTEKFRELFGFSGGEEISLGRMQERIHPRDRDIRRQALERALESGTSYDIEYRLFPSDGAERWVTSKGRAELDENGHPIRVLGVCIDVTERRRTEEEALQVSGRLITAQEDERTRLARELHDDLSQSLALLSVDLDLFGQERPDAGEHARMHMNDLARQVKDLSSEVHRLSHELHPAKLEQLGLVAALQSFCKDIAAAHRIAVQFDSRELPRVLPDAVALCLYRIAQEAVQNVVKHSGASAAHVQLMGFDSEISLIITDDGRGFDLKAAQRNATLGLISMRERARLVHGHLAVESKIDGGTRVEVRVALVPAGILEKNG